MKIAIVGSRIFKDYELLCSSVPPGIKEVVSGGADGADTLAEKYAEDNNLPKKIFLPKFKTDKTVGYHPSHFHIRNRSIVEYSDFILAFMPHGGSKGTQSTLNHAKKTGKPFKIIYF